MRTSPWLSWLPVWSWGFKGLVLVLCGIFKLRQFRWDDWQSFCHCCILMQMSVTLVVNTCTSVPPLSFYSGLIHWTFTRSLWAHFPPWGALLKCTSVYIWLEAWIHPWLLLPRWQICAFLRTQPKPRVKSCPRAFHMILCCTSAEPLRINIFSCGWSFCHLSRGLRSDFSRCKQLMRPNVSRRVVWSKRH